MSRKNKANGRTIDLQSVAILKKKIKNSIITLNFQFFYSKYIDIGDVS